MVIGREPPSGMDEEVSSRSCQVVAPVQGNSNQTKTETWVVDAGGV